MSYFNADIYTSELLVPNSLTIESGNITITNDFNLETTQQLIQTDISSSNIAINNINDNIFGVLSNESNIANTEKLQAIRLYGYRNDAGVYTDAHYPLTLNNDALNVNLSNITTTANINSEIQNFNDNKVGVYNTTPPTLTNNDEAKIRISDNAEPIIRQRCNAVTLPASKANTNIEIPISCTGGYIAHVNLPYRYDSINDAWIRDIGDSKNIIRDYRKNGNVYIYNTSFNYTNTSSSEDIYFFQNDSNYMYIYSVHLEAHSPNNPNAGEYTHIYLQCMINLNVGGSLPGSGRENSVSLNAFPQGDTTNYTTGNTSSGQTNKGEFMSLFIGNGARNHNELDLTNEFIRLRTNEGFRIRIEGNLKIDINYNLTIKYIRTTAEL